MKRRFVMAAAAAALVPRSGSAQSPTSGAFPDRPVRFVVPYAPGGSTDTSSRIVADRLAQVLGQQIVVEFLKASMPDSLRKRLDVVDFGTPVQTISTFPQGDNVRMVTHGVIAGLIVAMAIVLVGVAKLRGFQLLLVAVPAAVAHRYARLLHLLLDHACQLFAPLLGQRGDRNGKVVDVVFAEPGLG